MPDSYDAIVIGLGAMGSATAFHLAKRGLRTLGLDRYPPGHTHGSSHGESRIIRELYYEHPLFVPLVRRAYELWTELEAESRASLLALTGGLMVGVPTGRIVAGSRETAILHGIPFEYLDADEIRRRFPAFRPPDSFAAVWDARAGYLRADEVIRAHLALAARHGARLEFGEPVVLWEVDDGGVSVATPTRRYRADRLVLTLGPWTAHASPGLSLPLVPERQVVTWFDPVASAGDVFAPGRLPVFICEHALGQSIYGFPRLATGVKAAVYHAGETVPDPDDVRRTIDVGEIATLRSGLARFLPALAVAPIRNSATCLFTNAPDSRFVIDRHPAHPAVIICSACSGHGFKFSSVVGELNADLVGGRTTPFDLSPFSIARFAGSP
jgi:sarcosine oxidase